MTPISSPITAEFTTSTHVTPRVMRIGEQSLLFSFTAPGCLTPELALQEKLWALGHWLESQRQDLGLREIVPGMGNLLLQLELPAAAYTVDSSAAGSISDELCTHRMEQLAEQVLTYWSILFTREHLATREQSAAWEQPGQLHIIPVIYGGKAGPDLDETAAHCGFSAEQLIHRHCAGEYRVFCLGFQPGFAYLGGLDTALSTPRRANPRLLIPAGSVAIGGSQTGVYPSATPGGWNIIGHTDLKLFDPSCKPFSLLMPGDSVRFVRAEGSQ